MKEHINELIKLANKASKKGDVPVSTIILKNNKIISKAYNQCHITFRNNSNFKSL